MESGREIEERTSFAEKRLATKGNDDPEEARQRGIEDAGDRGDREDRR